MKLHESIVQRNSLTEKKSILSGATGDLALHHTMNGPMRKKATIDGLWVWLTPVEHDRIHADPRKMKALKAWTQSRYEKIFDHEEWMREYRKNYLEMNDEIDWELFKTIAERERVPRSDIRD